MNCEFCQYNDGCVYTSMPPRYRCTIDNEFHFGDYECDKEFVPVKHGQWIYLYSGNYKCSECGSWWICDETPIQSGMLYCPNCGARMEEEK